MEPENDKETRLVRSDSHGRIVKPGNLFDQLPPLANLPPEQQQQLVAKVVEHKINLDAAEKEAELKFETSGREMSKTVDQVRALENATRGDYTVRAEYETASGRTTVEVKRGTNLLLIVVAIIVAIVLLILFKSS